LVLKIFTIDSVRLLLVLKIFIRYWYTTVMKFSVVAIAALSGVLAAPQGNLLTSGLENLVGKSIEKNLEKQTGKKRPTGPDTFRLNRCVPAVLIVARGTSETGNVGTIIGGPICTALNARLGNGFSCQGVGAPGYPALFLDNTKAKGTCKSCIATAVKTINDVSAQCPTAKIAFLGYSQGAAVMHSAIPQLPPRVQSQIVAGVLFGDTQNKQSRASIKGFPQNKLRTFCARNDGVCNGGLNVNAGHVSYGEMGDVKRAVEFLAERFR